jgi:uncharacterized protein (DUF849 family)
MLLQACLNGIRTPGEHPALPITPQEASVNFSEPGTAELCGHFLSSHIGIEAGIWSVEDTHLLLKLGLADRCLRILIELQEPETRAAQAMAEAILQCLDDGDVRCPRLLHGDADVNVWPMLEVALHRGYETRIGLEDTLTLPAGQLAKDNAELVAHAVRKARQMGAL